MSGESNGKVPEHKPPVMSVNQVARTITAMIAAALMKSTACDEMQVTLFLAELGEKKAEQLLESIHLIAKRASK